MARIPTHTSNPVQARPSNVVSPDFNAEQEIAEGLSKMGMQMIESDITKEATEQATKDQMESGTTYVGEKKGFLGMETSRSEAYNKAARAIYLNEVNLDIDKNATEIAAKFRDDPDGASTALEDYHTNVLSNTPLMFQPAISAKIRGTSQKMVAGLKESLFQRQEEEQKAKVLVLADDMVRQYNDAMARGDHDGAMEIWTGIQASTEIWVSTGRMSPTQSLAVNRRIITDSNDAIAQTQYNDASTLQDKAKLIESIRKGEWKGFNESVPSVSDRTQIANRLQSEYNRLKAGSTASITLAKKHVNEQIAHIKKGYGESDPRQNEAFAAADETGALSTELHQARVIGDAVKAFKGHDVSEQKVVLSDYQKRAFSQGATSFDIELYEAAKEYHSGFTKAQRSGDLLEFYEENDVLVRTPLQVRKDKDGNVQLGDQEWLAGRQSAMHTAEAMSGARIAPFKKEETDVLVEAWKEGDSNARASIVAQVLPMFGNPNGTLDEVKMQEFAKSVGERSGPFADMVRTYARRDAQTMNLIGQGSGIIDNAKNKNLQIWGQDERKELTNKSNTFLRELANQPGTRFTNDDTEKSILESTEGIESIYIALKQRKGELGADHSFDQTLWEEARGYYLGLRLPDGKPDTDLPTQGGRAFMPFVTGQSASTNEDMWRSVTADDFPALFNGITPSVQIRGKWEAYDPARLHSEARLVGAGAPGRYRVVVEGVGGWHTLKNPTNGKDAILDIRPMQKELLDRASDQRDVTQRSLKRGRLRPSINDHVPSADQTSSETERRLNLSAQEKRIVDYHRNSIKTGNVGRDAEGRSMTVLSTGIKIPMGKHKGKFVSVPGWVNGKVLSEREAFDHWKDEIEAGKWPLYNTGEELNKRSGEIHQIMDEE